MRMSMQRLIADESADGVEDLDDLPSWSRSDATRCRLQLHKSAFKGRGMAFSENREFGEADLISAAAQLVPLSRTAREQLEALQQWASSGRARPASTRLTLRGVTNTNAR